MSNDLNAKESNGAIVGFDETDMDLIRECNLGKSIPKYQEIASKNQIIIGRPSDFEEYFGIQPEVGNSIKLKVFDGTETKEMEFSIAAVLDESKIGNNGDEGLLIVSIGLILSLIVGGFIGYLLCALLKNGLMTYLNYQFPFSVTLFYCVLVVICSLLVSEIALRHQKNMSLIELLRR